MIDEDGLRRSEHYARFHVARQRRVRVQAIETVDGVRAGRNFAAAKWEFRLRAYREVAAPQVLLLDLEMDKVVGTAAAGDTGKAEVTFAFTAADVGEVFLEVVVADTTVENQPTPSGYAEYSVEAPWRAAVFAAPGPAS